MNPARALLDFLADAARPPSQLEAAYAAVSLLLDVIAWLERIEAALGLEPGQFGAVPTFLDKARAGDVTSGP